MHPVVVTEHPSPLSAARRDEILAAPVFGDGHASEKIVAALSGEED